MLVAYTITAVKEFNRAILRIHITERVGSGLEVNMCEYNASSCSNGLEEVF
jgi:hypothetical protein